MSTMIAVYGLKGCVGRCDANCYEATHARCHCICGGRNHSAGKLRAEENVRARVGLELEDVDRFAARRGLKCEELRAIDRVAMPGARDARMAAHVALTQYDLFEERAPV